MTSSEPADLFSDDPDAGAAEGLGRGPFVKKALTTILLAGEKESSTVFGLVGPWGSGKTSILTHLERKVIEPDSNWSSVHFNPWNYSDMASLHHGFFTEVLNAFEGESDSAKLRERVSKFGQAVAPLASIGAVVGLDGSAAVTGISRLIAGDQSLASARRRLEKALAKRKSPLLVVMDDLDRLAPDELLLTLKLVRLIGRLPYVHYILAYDETTLLEVLSRTGLVGKKSISRARDYLEKVIQVRFDLPRLRPSDVLQLTNRGLAQSLVGADLSSEESARFSRAYFDHIGARLSTPRSIGRYFAQVKLFVADLPSEIDLSDFLILTWLRTSEPGAYSLIQKRRDELLSSTSNAKPEILSARAADWRRLLSLFGTSDDDIEGVAGTIGSLFPSFAAAWSGKPQSSSDPKARRASNPDYFDRYFSFGIADGDIADAEVSQGISDIHADRVTGATLKMMLALIESPDLLIGKLALQVESSKLASVPLLKWLASGHDHVPSTGGFISPQERVTALATRIMRRLPKEDLSSAIRGMSTDSSGFVLMLKSLEWSTSRSDDEPVDWLPIAPAIQAEVSEIAADYLDPCLDNGPFEFPPSLWSLIWPWMMIDEAAARAFVGRAQARWGAQDTIARFIGTSTIMGVPGAQPRLRDIDFDSVRRLLDLDELIEELRSEIASTDPVSVNYYERPDTPEERRKFALGLLRNERDRATSDLLASD